MKYLISGVKRREANRGNALIQRDVRLFSPLYLLMCLFISSLCFFSTQIKEKKPEPDIMRGDATITPGIQFWEFQSVNKLNGLWVFVMLPQIDFHSDGPWNIGIQIIAFCVWLSKT